MDIVARAKGMILTPAQEWSAVAAESTDVVALLRGYVMPLAGIAAIGALLSGIFSGFIVFAVVSAILSFVMTLVGVFVIGKIAEMLAPNFGAPADPIAGMKLAAHAPTASWIAAFFSFIPVIGAIIALVGAIYSLYLYYLGAPTVMRVPQDKAMVFTIAIIVAAIVVYLIVGALVGVIAGLFLFR